MHFKKLFAVKCRVEIHGAGPAAENGAVAGGMEQDQCRVRAQPPGVSPERDSRSRSGPAPAAAAPPAEPAHLKVTASQEKKPPEFATS